MHVARSVALVCRLTVASLLLTSAVHAQSVIYVVDDAPPGGDGTTWSTAYTYLQDALHVAVDDTEIHVAGGTYKPDQDEAGIVTSGDREASFNLINGVAIVGGYAGLAEFTDPDARDIVTHETILSGDLNGDDAPLACSDDSDCALGGFLCLNDSCIIPQDNEENSYHVITASRVDATAVLDGLTINGGHANGSYPRDNGGGMYNHNSSPTLTKCTFAGNSGVVGGGMCNERDSSPTLTDCTFSGNSAEAGAGMCNVFYCSPTLVNCTFSNNWGEVGGGMLNMLDSHAQLTNCTFAGNTALHDGGGVYSDSSHPVLANCVFSRNSAAQGGGMYDNIGNSVVTDCVFVGNSARRGGGMYTHAFSSTALTNCKFVANSAEVEGGGIYNRYFGSPKLTNCTLVANSATSGGAVYNADRSHPVFTNCTIAGNTAAELGGGVYTYGGDSTVSNCVFWMNTDISGTVEASQIRIRYGAATSVSFSLVQGLDMLANTGNIDSDPLFVDPDGPDDILGTEDDDLRLLAGSPAIDAADNTAVATGVTADLDGNPRFVDDPATDDTGNPGAPGPIVDMGAYEFQTECGNDLMDPNEECDGLSDEACPNHCVPAGELKACNCEPIGGCCDRTDGFCADSLYDDECLGEQRSWHESEECGSLEPPCERHTGACCDASPGTGGTCTDETYPEDCTGSHREWFKDMLCADLTCFEGTGACCDRTIFPGRCTDDVLAGECTCDECEWSKATACEEIDCVKKPIPTVSEWGLLVMTLLLLTGGKIAFGRRWARGA